MCHQDLWLSKAGLCVYVPILYDFRLHESVSSVFKSITLTYSVEQKGDIEECQEM